MEFKPANNIQDLQYFGEFGGVNPSISDSSTYTFLSAKTMFDTFEGNADGCYLYSRHSSPSNLYLGEALAAMEGTETANVSASGMGAIAPVLLQLCKSGDHIVSSRTIYGGTYAFLKNFMPRFNIETSFVDITKLAVVEGKAKMQLYQWKSYQRNFEVVAEETSVIIIRTYYYPAWHLYVNNQPYPINTSDDGTIKINLEKGNYQLALIYQWTSAFKLGVILSILSCLLLILYWLKIEVKARL